MSLKSSNRQAKKIMAENLMKMSTEDGKTEKAKREDKEFRGSFNTCFSKIIEKKIALKKRQRDQK